MGYEKTKVRSEDDDDDDDDDDPLKKEDAVFTTRLKVTLSKDPGLDTTGFCKTEAEAMVQRIPVLDSDPLTEKIETNLPILTLLNVASAPPSSVLKRVGMMLSRLDNLAHVLVWSKSKVQSAHSPGTIDYIELPRVNLSFEAKDFATLEGTKELRIYSNDYVDGLFIAVSNEAREIAGTLFGDDSHFIVLQNAEKDLFVLVPGCASPRRRHTDGSRLSV
jgi:hypothetical protein